MKSIAVIHEGMVVNLALFDDAGVPDDFDFGYGPGTIWVDVTGMEIDAQIGFKYEDGNFIKPPTPQPTREELILRAENDRYYLLQNANQVFVSWQTKLLLNRATEEEKAILNQWLDYFDNLRQLDLSNAPDIEWPEQPPIPEAGQ